MYHLIRSLAGSEAVAIIPMYNSIERTLLTKKHNQKLVPKLDRVCFNSASKHQ